MNYSILTIDYFIGLMEYGNVPHEARENAIRFANRFASKMSDEDMSNTMDIINRLVKLMEV